MTRSVDFDFEYVWRACALASLIPLTACPADPGPDAVSSTSGGAMAVTVITHKSLFARAPAPLHETPSIEAPTPAKDDQPSPEAMHEPEATPESEPSPGDEPDVEPPDASPPTCGCEHADKLAELGELLFNDRDLSASGTQSCASCHAASAAFTGNNRTDDPLFPVSRGAFDDLLGGRNTPTAMYMSFSPAFGFAAEAPAPGEAPELTPVGGQFWDGRADSLAEQAAGPFLNPREMALPSKQDVIDLVRAAAYAPLFLQVFGHDALDDVDSAYTNLTNAIAAFESTPAFSPFSSKFDAMLRGTAHFDAQEQLGFDLFKDPEKGNCISCHVGDPDSSSPSAWLFTDFTYDNLGVPRNTMIADNDDPEYFDLGLCKQPKLLEHIPDSVTDKDAFAQSLCGAFKVPGLRNVARTAPYMHNGYFSGLREVVEFYVTRETHPDKWYPIGADGSVTKYDDLPDAYKANVNTEEAPYDRTLGDAPRLDPQEIDAVVAFLRTLSDGYAPITR